VPRRFHAPCIGSSALTVERRRSALER
jgi:hypothetical protein